MQLSPVSLVKGKGLDLDFSDYFDHIRELYEIKENEIKEFKIVYEIFNLEPREIKDFKEEFCLGDCYIVLHSFQEDNALEPNSALSRSNHVIYTWIGTMAQLDKKFCCAMYAVGLKDYLRSTQKIIKVGPEEESFGFKELFPQLVYSNTYSTESGLFPVKEKSWNLVLYQLKDWALVNVEPIYTRLTSDFVFILDNGLDIYLWNGLDSSKQSRLKGRIVCCRINRNERKGRARVIEQEQGEEITRFWELLGCDFTPESFDFSTNDLLVDWKGPVLYKVPMGLEQDPLGDIVDSNKLKKSSLDSKECFILDAGSLLILWIGKNASHEKKVLSTEYLTVIPSFFKKKKIVLLQPRLKWTHVDRIVQHLESEVFKLYFSDWEDVQTLEKGIH